MDDKVGSEQGKRVWMIGLLALFGLLAAGLAVDLFLTSDRGEEGHDLDDGEADAEPGLDLLDDDAGYFRPVPSVAESARPEPVQDTRGETILGGEGADLILGTDFADDLSGGGGNDGIEGGAGNDRLDGGAGDDQIYGGAGDDHMLGGDGRDTLHGDFGDDTIFGGAGDDWIAGGMGDDLLSGDDGDDTLLGGSGDDTLHGGAGDDWLDGGYGNDLLVAGAGQNVLDGGAGNDTLIGAIDGAPGSGGNYLNGGRGGDVIVVGRGDIATGGEGADSFVLGGWMQGNIARIMDFEHAEDEIVVVYDPALSDNPEVTLQPGALLGHVTLLLDGVPLAQFGNAENLRISDIRLVPEAPIRL